MSDDIPIASSGSHEQTNNKKSVDSNSTLPTTESSAQIKATIYSPKKKSYYEKIMTIYAKITFLIDSQMTCMILQ